MKFKLTNDIFIEIIKDIEKLNLDCEKILITGSVTLCLYGLRREFKDVDIIIVNPTNECKYDLASQFTYIDRDYSSLRIQGEKWITDIFIEENLYNTADKAIVKVGNNIYLDTLDSIIDAKKRLHRKKDYIELQEMTNNLNLMNNLDNWNSNI